jgi:hypothetical protein
MNTNDSKQSANGVVADLQNQCLRHYRRSLIARNIGALCTVGTILTGAGWLSSQMNLPQRIELHERAIKRIENDISQTIYASHCTQSSPTSEETRTACLNGLASLEIAQNEAAIDQLHLESRDLGTYFGAWLAVAVIALGTTVQQRRASERLGTPIKAEYANLHPKIVASVHREINHSHLKVVKPTSHDLDDQNQPR